MVVKKKEIMIKKQIHFETGSAVIKEDSYAILDEVAAVMMENPQIGKISVEGHTDDRGEEDFNLKLSQDRAESVRVYLIQQGISPNRLEAVGYGESVPVVPNTSKRNRAKNRRVAFKIVAQ